MAWLSHIFFFIRTFLKKLSTGLLWLSHILDIDLFFSKKNSLILGHFIFYLLKVLKNFIDTFGKLVFLFFGHISLLKKHEIFDPFEPPNDLPISLIFDLPS